MSDKYETNISPQITIVYIIYGEGNFAKFNHKRVPKYEAFI